MTVLAFLLGILSGLIANFFSPAFSRWAVKWISRALFWIDNERFDLSGLWVHTYQEPTPGSPQDLRTVTERVELNQLGVTVTGIGKTEIDPREFSYALRVNHALVFGSYTKRAEKGNIVGSGMVQLVVDNNRLSMKGQATWFDGDTQQIESSQVTWRRL